MMAEKSRVLAQKKLRGRGRQGTAARSAQMDEFEIEISTSSSSKKSGSSDKEGDLATGGGTEIDKLLELETDPQKRIIAHVDMDCFYVSVLTRNKPELKGRPVIVCPSKNVQGTSEVASASYEARQCGIRARMFVNDARKLCPDLVVLPCDYALIEDASARVYEQILKYSVLIEPVSADEAYLDVSAWGWHRTEEFAARLRSDIQEATGCPCSVGVGPNKLLARLSTAYAKPLGVRIMRMDQDMQDFLGRLFVHELPGVGRNLIAKLEAKQIKTVADVRSQSLQRLQLWFGDKNGAMLHEFAAGRDERPVQTQHKRKSVGTQISWGVRLFSQEDVKKFLSDVAQEVSKRLREINSKGSRLTLRILKRADAEEHGEESHSSSTAITSTSGEKHMPPPVAPPKGKFMNPGAVQPVSRSMRLVSATNDAAILGAEALKIFRTMNMGPTDVRGVGFSVDNLEDCEAVKTERTIDSFFSPQASKKEPKNERFEVEDIDDLEIVDQDRDDEPSVPLSHARTAARPRRTPAHLELVYDASSSSSSQDNSQPSQPVTNTGTFGDKGLVIPGTPPQSDDEMAGFEFDDEGDVISLSSEVEMYDFTECTDDVLIVEVKEKNSEHPHLKKRKLPDIEDDVILVDSSGEDHLPPPKRQKVADATQPESFFSSTNSAKKPI